MTANGVPEIVPAWIRAHVTLIHQLAAPLVGKGIVVVTAYGEDPGEIGPNAKKPGRAVRPKVSHAAIGEIKETLRGIAQFIEQPHYNLYMPLAIYGPDLPSGAKGSERDIVACLGIVADFDDAEAKRWAGTALTPELRAGEIKPPAPVSGVLPLRRAWRGSTSNGWPSASKPSQNATTAR